MYVCICNAIKERQVKKALSDGIKTIRGLHDFLEYDSCCGKCTDELKNMLIKYQSAHDKPIAKNKSAASSPSAGE